MRLIDADALKDKAFGRRKVLVHSSDIDAAPTIDAIPMEWIVSWINRHPNDLRCVWFASIEMEWRKEQEAR